MTLTVSTTFTSEPLGEHLEYWMQLLQLPLGVEFAPYGQLFQELLSPTSTLAQNRDGVCVVLVRVEDWARTKGTDEGVAQSCEDFLGAFADFVANRRRVPVVLGLLPPTPTLTTCFDSLARATELVRREVGALSGVTLLEQTDWERYAPRDVYDARSDELAHIPYTSEFFAALSGGIARKIHALKVPARKVLVLDCDNTLWGGVVGEDGPEGISLDAPFLELQRFASQQQKQGTLVCLCSKNVEADVEQAFQVRSDFALRWDQLVVNRINWESKAANIQSLAEELNLGLDSFVFLDDNIVECETVRAALPGVATLHLRQPADIATIVRHLWPLDKLTVTREDLERTEMYRQNAARNRLEKQAPSLQAFLSQLNLVTKVAAPEPHQWSRVSQLTQRTNQFNFTTVRRSEDELRALVDAGVQIRVISVSDRFGDYGDTGVTIYREQGDSVVFDTMLLSCRVLGRGVEHEMLAEVGRYAQSRGLSRLVLPFKKTKKNEPALKFLRSLTAATYTETEDGFEFALSVDDAAAAVFRPESADSVQEDQEKPASSGEPTSSGARISASELYQRITGDLSTAKGIVEAVHQQRMASSKRMLRELAARPSTDEEAQMLGLWEELLAIEGLGVEDDYFSLGGTSLLAVKLSIAVERRFGVRLPLTAVVEAPTVRSLVKRMREMEAGGLVALRTGGPRRFFLIHDGDGETLLYRNLADRLSDEFTVYGVQPKSSAIIPLLHTRIEQMAEHYATLIRQLEPHGPYYLGGLCAGGTLAFAVAAHLEATGSEIAQLVLMDAAAPNAVRRKGLVARERWQRFSNTLLGGWGRSDSASDSAQSQNGQSQSGADTSSSGPASSPPPSSRPPSQGPRRSMTPIPGALAKVGGVIRYELEQQFEKATNKVRFGQLRTALDTSADLAPFKGALTFRQIYDLAEDDYTPRVLHGKPVLLVLATSGEGSDRPFRELYVDPDLGWQKYVQGPLRTVEVSGGHSSMLQAEHVHSLAKAMRDGMLSTGHGSFEVGPGEKNRESVELDSFGN